MRTLLRLLPLVAVTLLGACAGAPVALGTRTLPPLEVVSTRVVTAKACGFQLLLFIPINVNDRMERAYQLISAQAGADYITDVQIEESWTYGFVGTAYCTTLKAKALREGAVRMPSSPSTLPPATPPT